MPTPTGWPGSNSSPGTPRSSITCRTRLGRGATPTWRSVRPTSAGSRRGRDRPRGLGEWGASADPGRERGPGGGGDGGRGPSVAVANARRAGGGTGAADRGELRQRLSGRHARDRHRPTSGTPSVDGVRVGISPVGAPRCAGGDRGGRSGRAGARRGHQPVADPYRRGGHARAVVLLGGPPSVRLARPRRDRGVRVLRPDGHRGDGVRAGRTDPGDRMVVLGGHG